MTDNLRTWICSQIGARQHYAVPVGFHRDGLLELLFTDIWTPSALRHFPWPSRRLRAFARRYHNEIPANRLTHFRRGALAREGWFKFKKSLRPSTNLFEH